MTWGNVKQTGSGSVALRLVIEGKRYQWVTDSLLAGSTTDDRERVVGLLGDSIVWSDKCNIANATLESEGFTARIVDVSGKATEDFATMPDQVTYLGANLSSSGTTMVVYDSGVFDVDEYIDLGTETMQVTAIPTPISLTVSRAMRDSFAQAHYTNDGDNLRAPQVTNRPVSIEGRRVYVYAYGDTFSGNGTLVYRGICATEARLVDGTTWEITVDPLSSLLQQDVGTDLSEAVEPRGIYYNTDHDLRINLAMYNSADLSDYPREVAAFHFAEELGTDGYVFFESQDGFLEALNDLIVDKTSGWAAGYALDDGSTAGSPVLKAIPDAEAGWVFQYRTGSTPRWLTVTYASPVDCGNITSPDRHSLISGSDPVDTVSASTTYKIPNGAGDFPGAGQVPRGFFFGVSPTGRLSDDPYLSEGQLIPLGGTAAPTSDFVTCSIQWPTCGPYVEEEVQCRIRSVDTANRFISVVPLTESRPNAHPWAPGALPKITFGRVFVEGNLWDYIQDVMDNAADGANVGRVPFLVDGEDFDSSTSEANVDAMTASSPLLSARIYGQFKPMKLIDVITPELILMGGILSTSEDGGLVIRRLRTLAATETTDGEITASHQLNFPSWERNAFGSVNTVILKTGWDAREDKYKGRTFVVRDVGSLARNKTARKLELEPKSYLDGDADSSVSESDVLSTISPLIGLLGYPYDVVTFVLPLTHFDYHIGDTLNVTSAQIPNRTGTRGVTSGTGIVIGRKCAIMEGTVELTLLMTLQQIFGYAPTWRVASYTGTNPYTITVESAGRPDGYSEIDEMSAGDLVQIANIDSSSPTVRTGTVTSVTPGTNSFVITLSGAIPAGTLNVDYQSATAVQTSQQIYAFMADGTNTIGFSPTETTAVTFSP